VKIGPYATVTGGTYPALIWHAFMTAALAGTPVHDFGAAPALDTKRGPRTLYLPGVQCVYTPPPPPADTSTTNGPVAVTTTTTIDTHGLPLAAPDALIYPCAAGPPPPPTTTAPPTTPPPTTVAPTTTEPATTTTSTTLPPTTTTTAASTTSTT